ncbi:MAG: hypothetical protein QM800_01650 [Paludibacter sp.]
MREKHLFLAISFLFIMALMIGCEKDNNEIKQAERITFDNMEVLYNALPSGSYTAIRFTLQNTAYTITNNGWVFKTKDGGNTWGKLDSGTEQYLYDMFFFR